MNFASKIKNLRVIIATHEYATGPSHALEVYLRDRVASLTFIAHPFVFAKEKRSHMRSYRAGKPPAKEVFFPIVLPIQALNVLKDILLTLWWSVGSGPADLYVGVDNINASVGVILQKIGFVKRTAFYTIDYIPQRFTNSLLNRLYHVLDAFAVRHVDVVWNLSSIMEKEREKVGLARASDRKKQVVVPVGTDETVAQRSLHRIARYHVAHMGHLTRKQGVQLLIWAVPLIKKRLPQFHVRVIGGGPMEGELKEMARSLGVTRDVTFYGFIKNHDEVEKLLSQCAVAVAPYIDSPDNFVRYTDPGKVKAYLAVGLPVVITRVPAIWREIEQKGAGVAVSDTPQGVARGIQALLSDTGRLRQFREHAAAMGRLYLWRNVFKQALGRTLS